MPRRFFWTFRLTLLSVLPYAAAAAGAMWFSLDFALSLPAAFVLQTGALVLCQKKRTAVPPWWRGSAAALWLGVMAGLAIAAGLLAAVTMTVCDSPVNRWCQAFLSFSVLQISLGTLGGFIAYVSAKALGTYTSRLDERNES